MHIAGLRPVSLPLAPDNTPDFAALPPGAAAGCRALLLNYPVRAQGGKRHRGVSFPSFRAPLVCRAPPAAANSPLSPPPPRPQNNPTSATVDDAFWRRALAFCEEHDLL